MLAITLDTPDSQFGQLVAMDRTGQRFLTIGTRPYIYALTVSPIYGAPAVWMLEAVLENRNVGSVALDGDLAVEGQCHYNRAPDGTWSASRTFFGDNLAVAIFGDLVAITNPPDKHAPFFALWTKVEIEVSAPPSIIQPPVPVDYGGPKPPRALAMRAGIVVAGCPDSGPPATASSNPTGIVYVCEFGVGESFWRLTPLLPASLDSAGAYGAAVDLDDDFIIIGQPGGLNDAGAPTGAVQIVSRSDFAVTVIKPSTNATQFGRAVALRNGSAVVGGVNDGLGAIWYLRQTNGTWQFTSEPFTPIDDPDDTTFGSSLSLSDKDPDSGLQALCVGAPGRADGEGAVYVGSGTADHDPAHRESSAVDPMSLILSQANYIIWLEAHHPQGPSVAEVVAALKAMPHSERRATLARSRTLGRYARVFETAAAALAAGREG